jgi:Phage tail tube protein, GTA-gp10
MANKHRGDIDAQLDGKTYRLCLTLGALAELEDAFGAEDMLSLATRFESGRISSRDCMRIIGAGLRGGGHDIADASVATMQAENGAAGFIAIVAKLLNATFAGGQSSAAKTDVRTDAAGAPVTASLKKERERAAPFPGTT